MLVPEKHYNTPRMSGSKYDRRAKQRLPRQVPALLHRSMVKTINLSEDGARLLINSTKPLKEKMPLLIQTGDNDFAGLLCEPRWVEEVGENLYVVGVSFPEGQEDLGLLKRALLQEE